MSVLTNEITAQAKLYGASAVFTKETMYRAAEFISSTVTAPCLLGCHFSKAFKMFHITVLCSSGFSVGHFKISVNQKLNYF